MVAYVGGGWVLVSFTFEVVDLPASGNIVVNPECKRSVVYVLYPKTINGTSAMNIR